MIKLIYIALVMLVFLPAVFFAVVCIQSESVDKQLQKYLQNRTPDSVSVARTHTTIGWGRFGVEVYPRVWVGIVLLAAVVLCIAGLVFFLFVHQ